MNHIRYRRGQSGVALVVGLIMLIVMTVAVIVSFNVANTSLLIVGNMKSAGDVHAAAEATIQEAISTVRMFQSPDTVFLQPCNGVNNTRCFDINEDGEDDITVALVPAPTCVQAGVILNASLDVDDPDSAACATSTTQLFGVAGVATGNSLCANSIWEITAVATDLVTSAQATVTEGAAVRVLTDDVATSCPSAPSSP